MHSTKQIVKYFLLFLFVQLHAEQSLHYSIKPDMHQGRIFLRITMTMHGFNTKKTVLELPNEWAGLCKLEKNIVDLRVKTKDVRIQNGKKPHFKVLQHARNQAVALEYCVYGCMPNEHAYEFHNPLSTSDYFHAIGHTFLIVPRTSEHSVTRSTFTFIDMPAHWHAVSSFGAGAEHRSVGHAWDVWSAVFFIGNIRVHKSDICGHPVYFAVHGDFDDESLVRVSNAVIENQRRFWNDFNFPHFLITVLEKPSTNPRRMLCGGTGLTHSFASFATKNVSLERFKYLFSHELFHTWNGTKISNAKPEGSGYWFSEGFTEYYGYELNRRAGIITEREYQEGVREIIAEYMGSPVRNLANSEVEKKFWNNKDVQRLPYIRGFVFALYLDNKIKQATAGAHSLDSIMKDILARVTITHEKMSNELLQSIAQKYIVEGISQDLERYIENGQTIVL